MSGRGGNIMIEKNKWYHPLLPVGGMHANTLCFNEGIFQRVYSSVPELSPACHSVCHRETEIQYARLCGLNPPPQCQNKFTETQLTTGVSLTQHLLLSLLVCVVSFLILLSLSSRLRSPFSSLLSLDIKPPALV